jgi:ribonucleotide reductase beta subunit family protein with ferritin-like domain
MFDKVVNKNQINNFLRLLVKNIQINLTILSYFLEAIAIITSFIFVLYFFNNKKCIQKYRQWHLEISNIDKMIEFKRSKLKYFLKINDALKDINVERMNRKTSQIK